MVQPETPKKTSIRSKIKAVQNTGALGWTIARNVGSQRAENPQTTGTRNPQASNIRYFWSRACGKARSVPLTVRRTHSTKLKMTKAASPAVPINTETIRSEE